MTKIEIIGILQEELMLASRIYYSLDEPTPKDRKKYLRVIRQIKTKLKKIDEPLIEQAKQGKNDLLLILDRSIMAHSFLRHFLPGG